ncbi:MAG: DUF1343 domain-containing protein [Simkaniaceae bacterium]|nr:DUF1343 domain-containing protein [Simkaniaceae bacterium]
MRFLVLLFTVALLHADVELGVDRLFSTGKIHELKAKRLGLITNHTGVDKNLRPTFERLSENYKVVALFAPEHGITGSAYAGEHIKTKKGTIPVYSLHGKTRRPTEKMLKGIDVLIYDIQDIGVRSYTYASTLYYAMEEAAKHKIPVIVLDRPNPQGGLVVDGPMLKPKWRSFLGYVNIAYCHGMTIGELASFFNSEYGIKCNLDVVQMKGWTRSMTFKETGLSWVPPSPNIPEPDTPSFCASTGILGELSIVNIGIGYTLPFKVVGAPWIDANQFAKALNDQKLPGVQFTPFHYRPFAGSLKGKECHGVLINVTDSSTYRPLSVQYLLIGVLKSLYPKKVLSALASTSQGAKDFFCKANGNDEMLTMLTKQKFIAYPLMEFDRKEREKFMKIRAKYLFY